MARLLSSGTAARSRALRAARPISSSSATTPVPANSEKSRSTVSRPLMKKACSTSSRPCPPMAAVARAPRRQSRSGRKRSKRFARKPPGWRRRRRPERLKPRRRPRRLPPPAGSLPQFRPRPCPSCGRPSMRPPSSTRSAATRRTWSASRPGSATGPRRASTTSRSAAPTAWAVIAPSSSRGRPASARPRLPTWPPSLRATT